MKMLSLFSGIGAFEQALTNLGLEYELVGYCEIDKYASKSYAAIHDVSEDMNLGDITKIDEKELPKDIDLITYGFPCQDISLAGKQKGLFECEHCHIRYELEERDAEKIRNGEKFFCEKCGNEIKLTRSGLFFEALRIIEETKPRVAIAENVKNLVGKKFKEQFEIVLDSLEQAGYNNYWQVLNAKDFGVPQNRERVFIVSVRKDIDDGLFEFPQGFPLELRLKDLLENDVDEKFYLDGKYENLIKINNDYSVMNGGTIGKMHDISRRAYSEDSIAPTIPTCAGGNTEPKVMRIGNVNPSGRGQNGTVIDANGLARTVTLEKGEGQKIMVRENNKRGWTEAIVGDTINFEQPGSKTRRGRVGRQVAQTLNTATLQGVVVDE